MDEVLTTNLEVLQEVVKLLGQPHFRMHQVQRDGRHHDGAGVEERVVRFP